MAVINFDATTVDPNVSRDTLPAGDYLCVIDSSEMKSTKAGDGWYIEIVRSIIDGPHKGRKLWQRINWENPSKQAQEIGRRQFSNVCHAIGRLQVIDTAETHGIPHVAKVRYIPAKGDFPAKNEVDSCSKWDGQPLAAPASAVPAASPWAVAATAQPSSAWSQPATPPVAATVIPAPPPVANSATPPWMQAKR